MTTGAAVARAAQRLDEDAHLRDGHADGGAEHEAAGVDERAIVSQTLSLLVYP